MQCKVTIRRSWRNAAQAATAAIVFCTMLHAPALAAQSSTAPAAAPPPAPSAGARMWSYDNMRRSVDEKSMGAQDKMPGILGGVGI